MHPKLSPIIHELVWAKHFKTYNPERNPRIKLLEWNGERYTKHIVCYHNKKAQKALEMNDGGESDWIW